MNHSNTFPDEEKKQWAETCPACGEEFIKHRGGSQCQSNCSAFILQTEHERALFSMVDYALPQYRIEVNCPKDWNVKEERVMGVSQAFATPPILEIPWYTLRMKSTFFDTTVHELGHISSLHAKNSLGYISTTSSYRRTIRKFIKVWYKDKFPFRKRRAFSQNPKVRHFWEEKERHGGHSEDAWQSEYERLHEKLMNSAYSRYNYASKPPYSYPRSINWNWD